MLPSGGLATYLRVRTHSNVEREGPSVSRPDESILLLIQPDVYVKRPAILTLIQDTNVYGIPARGHMSLLPSGTVTGTAL